MAKAKTKGGGSSSVDDRELRLLGDFIGKRGIRVRRENLSRGHSFKVKSGKCWVSNGNILFVDKRLTNDQQLSILLDFLIEQNMALTNDEMALLSEKSQTLLVSVSGFAVSPAQV